MKYERFKIRPSINKKEDYFLCSFTSKKKEESYDPNIYTIDKEVIMNNIKYYITHVTFSVYSIKKDLGSFKVLKETSYGMYEEEEDPIIKLELSNYI